MKQKFTLKGKKFYMFVLSESNNCFISYIWKMKIRYYSTEGVLDGNKSWKIFIIDSSDTLENV